MTDYFKNSTASNTKPKEMTIEVLQKAIKELKIARIKQLAEEAHKELMKIEPIKPLPIKFDLITPFRVVEPKFSAIKWLSYDA